MRDTAPKCRPPRGRPPEAARHRVPHVPRVAANQRSAARASPGGAHPDEARTTGWARRRPSCARSDRTDRQGRGARGNGTLCSAASGTTSRCSDDVQRQRFEEHRPERGCDLSDRVETMRMVPSSRSEPGRQGADVALAHVDRPDAQPSTLGSPAQDPAAGATRNTSTAIPSGRASIARSTSTGVSRRSSWGTCRRVQETQASCDRRP
jgi:hypothetical protein